MKVLLFQTKLKLQKVVLEKKDGSLDDLELGVQVDHSLNKIGDDKFELILTTKVADQDEKVCVWVKGRAIFNTQPGMAPILLPAMNIVAMLNDQKKRKVSEWTIQKK